MASYILSASGTSANLQINTNKVRIATSNAAIAINTGNANTVTANITGGATGSYIIPANFVERDIYVGQGNYLAYIGAASTTISVTELGAPMANTAYTNGNTII